MTKSNKCVIEYARIKCLETKRQFTVVRSGGKYFNDVDGEKDHNSFTEAKKAGEAKIKK